VYCIENDFSDILAWATSLRC